METFGKSFYGCFILFFFLVFAVIVPFFLLTGGFASEKIIVCPIEEVCDGKTIVVEKPLLIKPYGFLTEDERKIDGIKYELSTGNLVCSIIFIETIVVPVYLLGCRLYEPVGLDTGPEIIIKKPNK
jgi:hypothetical protein